MRRNLSCIVSALLWTLLSGVPASASTAPYYLALGDSLARGVQPNSRGVSVRTRQGYPNLLLRAERRSHPRLRLMNLGCPGESTTTMLRGGICHYRAGSQIAAARRFIRRHRIAFITIDIGANDVDACSAYTGTQVQSCLQNGLKRTRANLPMIVRALRQVAGPRIRVAGMTYYDPFLAFYVGDALHRLAAQASIGSTQSLNNSLIRDFKAQGVRLADVASAFHTYTPWTRMTQLGGHGTVPVAVASICRLTWMCAPAPRGPNVHANKAGYKKIAEAFAAKL
jgi:lysophospholipase L1-like esterase